jgi:hypothetical protein
VRGIATGDALRRLVSRTLARHFADVLDQATRPFQFALKARAGTDALAGLITAALDLDPECTVVSLDGRAAYDSISRAAFLSQVRSSVPSLLPFAKAFYGQTSTYYWWDDGGTRHTIAQGEGCEQGDALAPALFALGQHAGLLAAATQLQPGETLAAYLDDLYILTSPARARTCLDAVSRAVHAHSGIAANLGKTRVFHRAGGPPPPGIRDLGPDVWCGGEQPPEECGFLALGTPIGTPAYVQAASADRVRRQADFLRELPHLPDLQAAWLLLTYCAAPRAQHLLRTVPPTLSATAAAAHDEAVWETLARLLQEPAPTALPLSSRTLAFLPARLGGLGLYAAARLAPAGPHGLTRCQSSDNACRLLQSGLPPSSLPLLPPGQRASTKQPRAGHISMPKAGPRDLPGTSFSLVPAPRRPSTKQSPAFFGTAGNNPQRSSFIPHTERAK